MLRPPYDVHYDFALRQRDIDASLDAARGRSEALRQRRIDALEHLRVMRSDCIASHGRAALREHAIRADLEMVASEFPAHVSDAAANFLLRGHESHPKDGDAAALLLGPNSGSGKPPQTGVAGRGTGTRPQQGQHVQGHHALGGSSAHALTPTSDILTAAAQHAQHVHATGGATPERAQFLHLLPESPGLRGIVATHMPHRHGPGGVNSLHSGHPLHPTNPPVVRSSPVSTMNQQAQQQRRLQQQQHVAGIVASSRASVAPGFTHSGGRGGGSHADLGGDASGRSAQFLVVSPPSEAGDEADALEDDADAGFAFNTSGDVIGDGIAAGVTRRLDTSGVSSLSPASQRPQPQQQRRQQHVGLTAPHRGTGINPPHPSFPNSTAGATTSGSVDGLSDRLAAGSRRGERLEEQTQQQPVMLRTLPPREFSDGTAATTAAAGGSYASYSFDPNAMEAELHHRHDAAAHGTCLRGRESGTLRQHHRQDVAIAAATGNVSLRVVDESHQTITVNHSAATLPPPQRSPQRQAPQRPPLHNHHGTAAALRGESPPPESPLPYGPPKAVPPPPPRSPQWDASGLSVPHIDLVTSSQTHHHYHRHHHHQLLEAQRPMRQDTRAFSWEGESSTSGSPNGTLTLEVPVTNDRPRAVPAAAMSGRPFPPPPHPSSGAAATTIMQHPSRASLATLAASGAPQPAPAAAINSAADKRNGRASLRDGTGKGEAPVPGYLMSDSSTDEIQPEAAERTINHHHHHHHAVARTLRMDEVTTVTTATTIRSGNGTDYSRANENVMPYASAALAAVEPLRAAVKAPQRRLPPPASSPVWRQRGEPVYGSPVGGGGGKTDQYGDGTVESMSPEMPRDVTPSPTFFV